MSKLILACHGQTPFNAEGRWTGLTDVSITEQGLEEAREAGRYIDSQIDVINVAHCSMLRRTEMSTRAILGETACCPNLDFQAHAALNERDYGMYTGQLKNDVRQDVGEEEFLRIRRGWNHPIPDGESLKDIHDKKVVPFHERIVTPDLKRDKTILVVSSNNTLRAYVKYLEHVPDEDAHGIELGTAEVRIYELDDQLAIVDKTAHAIGDVHWQ